MVLGSLAALAAGCKPRPFQVSTTAYILGPQSQIIPIDASDESQIPPAALNASTLIATTLQSKQVKFCSGTLIAPEKAGDPFRVLANHHCFAQADASDKALPDLLPEACTETKVYFGFVQGRSQSATEGACAAGSLRTSYQGDIAVFTLVANPPAQYQPLDLWDGEDAPAGRQALIVHYPDTDGVLAEPPDGGAKLPTAQATLNNCKTVGPFDVNEWDLDRTLPFSLRHSCDLIHGSSGSGLIDVETGKILGVNWGGIQVTYESGTRTDNVATKASFVAAYLKGSVDQVVAAAAAERAAAVALDAKKNEAVTKDGVLPLKAKACGVAEAAEEPLMALLLLGGVLAPLVIARRRD
jgi:hypothetical protein